MAKLVKSATIKKSIEQNKVNVIGIITKVFLINKNLINKEFR